MTIGNLAIKTTTLAMLIACNTMVSPSQAATQVIIGPNGFSPIGIDVISEDGKTWTKVKSKQLLLTTTIGLGRSDEEVLSFRARQGWLAQSSDEPWLHRETLPRPQARVDRSLTLSGSTDLFTPVERTQILKSCNAKLSSGGSIHQTYKLFHGVRVQLAGFFTSSGGAGTTNVGGTFGKFGNGTATVQVTCKGVLAGSGPGDIVAEEPKNLKVGSIELFRSTFKNAVSKPNPGTVCKKARLLVRVKTNKKGPVKFKLWTKIGNKPATSKLVDAWSKHTGSGGFEAEYTQWVTVDKTSFVQAKAEELINPIGLSTPWKSITLHCTGAGGGGFADAPKPGDDEPLVSPLKVTGNLTLADKAGAPKDKPRLGAAVFKIWTNKPGPTSYKLTCGGGRQWTGTLKTYKKGPHKYQAVGLRNFQVDKTEKIGCALRSTSLSNDAIVAIATKTFVMANPKPQIESADKVTAAKPKPTHASQAEKRRKKLKILKRLRAKQSKKSVLKKRRQLRIKRKANNRMRVNN